jgi:hypothetical protein
MLLIIGDVIFITIKTVGLWIMLNTGHKSEESCKENDQTYVMYLSMLLNIDK